MRFERFREVETHMDSVERIREREEKRKEEGYKKIKPETNISVEEAKSYWENVFGSIFN